jgi:hypothetical protein
MSRKKEGGQWRRDDIYSACKTIKIFAHYTKEHWDSHGGRNILLAKRLSNPKPQQSTCSTSLWAAWPILSIKVLLPHSLVLSFHYPLYHPGVSKKAAPPQLDDSCSKSVFSCFLDATKRIAYFVDPKVFVPRSRLPTIHPLLNLSLQRFKKGTPSFDILPRTRGIQHFVHQFTSHGRSTTTGMGLIIFVIVVLHQFQKSLISWIILKWFALEDQYIISMG